MFLHRQREQWVPYESPLDWMLEKGGASTRISKFGILQMKRNAAFFDVSGHAYRLTPISPQYNGTKIWK